MEGSFVKTIDNCTFELKEDHSFDWLASLGKVFRVFDQQDSGNICFGIEKEGIKSFVKYAGARTLHYNGEPEKAVIYLKRAASLYETLKHPHLVQLLDHFSVGDGYALTFRWSEGESLHPHWTFPPPLKYEHPDSPFYRFRNLSVDNRLKALDCIFDFHVHVERKNFVAIDFYDGSLLYDFKTTTTTICDIDYYKKKPYVNLMGKMWGSSRFQSPEENKRGSLIDARTNVFTMGATAFVLVGGGRDRTIEAWEANAQLYEVALSAVQEDRFKRFSTVEDFYDAWRRARQS